MHTTTRSNGRPPLTAFATTSRASHAVPRQLPALTAAAALLACVASCEPAERSSGESDAVTSDAPLAEISEAPPPDVVDGEVQPPAPTPDPLDPGETCTIDSAVAAVRGEAALPVCTDPFCALEAYEDGEPFVYQETLQGIDSELVVAFLRRPGATLAVRVAWDSSPCGGGSCGAVAYVSSCTQLAIKDSCMYGNPVNCLECQGQGPSATVCSGSAPAPLR